jgi:hypothetical protein
MKESIMPKKRSLNPNFSIYETETPDVADLMLEVGRLNKNEVLALKQRQTMQNYLPRAYDR